MVEPGHVVQAIDLGKEVGGRGLAENLRPQRAEIRRHTADDWRVHKESLLGRDEPAHRRKLFEDRPVAAGEMREHRVRRWPPGALEIDQRAILVEQNGTDRHGLAKTAQGKTARGPWRVAPLVARSARISPITGANLKRGLSRARRRSPAVRRAAGR